MQPFIHWFLVLPALSLLGAGYSHSGAAISGATEPNQLVAEAPIWGPNNGAKGYAFLPVTIHGHAATIGINLNCTECDLSLSTAALGQVGVTLASTTATTLDTLIVGTDTQRNVPLKFIQGSWSVSGPPQLPPVVGIVGVHFLTIHYDILYDYPGRRVRLYAISPKPVDPSHAWLPPAFKPTDCGKMVDIPPGAATFTGVEMQVDGHPVIGALEMGPYFPKMNETAFKALGLPAQSPRVQPGQPGESDGGHVLKERVLDVKMTVGKNMFGTWKAEVLQELDVQEMLPPNTPVMLLNLSMLRNVVLFNSTSSKQVCVAKP